MAACDQRFQVALEQLRQDNERLSQEKKVALQEASKVLWSGNVLPGSGKAGGWMDAAGANRVTGAVRGHA